MRDLALVADVPATRPRRGEVIGMHPWFDIVWTALKCSDIVWTALGL